jgi:lysozyme
MTDPRFSTNWAGMNAAGLLRGTYHFGHPGTDAVAHAKRFFEVVHPTHGDLPLIRCANQ